MACMQVASDGLLQAASAATSVPRAVSHAFGVSVFDRLSGLGFAPVFIRDVVVSAALRDGRFGDAEREVGGLPAGVERDDFAGQVSEAHGDTVGALKDFARAGDIDRVSDSVDKLLQSGNSREALAMMHDLVPHLQHSNDDTSLARAYWKLAQVESAAGDHKAASRDFEQALVLFPLSETYLLGAANEALQFGSLHEAGEYFDSVVRLDPASLDGHIGVGRVAARQGDLVRAREEAEFVRAHDSTYRDLQTLKDEIARAKTAR